MKKIETTADTITLRSERGSMTLDREQVAALIAFAAEKPLEVAQHESDAACFAEAIVSLTRACGIQPMYTHNRTDVDARLYILGSCDPPRYYTKTDLMNATVAAIKRAKDRECHARLHIDITEKLRALMAEHL